MSHLTLDNTDCQAAIESLPHLAKKMCALWNTRDLETFVHSVLMDSREGTRRGLPVEVAKEMMFVAKLNTLVRAMDTAAQLQMSLAEAGRVIQAGDRVALGLPDAGIDPWAEHVLLDELPNVVQPIQKPATAPADRQPARQSRPPVQDGPVQFEEKPVARAADSSGKGSTKHYMSIFLNETPPIPPLVRVDVTAGAPGERPSAMSSEFFRCIAREIRGLGVDELVLSHLGNAGQCPWLIDGIRFAKQHCRFPQVHMRVDPLNASDQELEDAIAAGLDCLVFDFNVASEGWRARAAEPLVRNPNHYALRLSHILQKREEIYSRTLHRCIVKVAQTGKTVADHPMTEAIAKLAGMADTFSVDWLHELAGQSEGDAAEDGMPAGGCLCWAPFIEANISPDGHLLVCSHDNEGTSFVADLKRTEFAEAWHAEEFRRTRQGLLNGTIKGTLCAACCPRASR